MNDQIIFTLYGYQIEGDPNGHEMNLTERCAACRGMGKVADFEAEKISTCGECRGRGAILTENGNEILRFLQTWTVEDIRNED